MEAFGEFILKLLYLCGSGCSFMFIQLYHYHQEHALLLVWPNVMPLYNSLYQQCVNTVEHEHSLLPLILPVLKSRLDTTTVAFFF